jgi:hypothetical protein
MLTPYLVVVVVVVFVSIIELSFSVRIFLVLPHMSHIIDL